MTESAPALYRAFIPARTGDERMPLLLLNSLATTTTIWEPLLPQLTDDRPVILLDYAGHGRSPARSTPETLPDLSRDILAVLRRMDVNAVHVAGVSIGGLAGLQMARDAPDVVRSLTVIGSTPVMEHALWQRRRELVAEWGTPGVIGDVIRRWFTPEFAERRPEAVQEYSTLLAGTSDTAYMAYSTLLSGLDIRSWLPEVSTPTVVVSGGSDAAATPEQGRMIATGVAAGRHEVLHGVAHMVQAMAANDLARIIRSHIAAVEADGAG